MDFRLTEDQAILVEGVRDFLAGVHGAERLRRLDMRDPPRSPELWAELTSMGLPCLLVPVAEGGLGLGLVEAVLIAQELGRAAVAEPIVDTALVAVPWLVARAVPAPYAAIVAGEARIAVAHPVNPWIADLDDATHVIARGSLLARHGDAGAAWESVDPLRRLFASGDIGEGDDLLLDLGALMAAAQLRGLADAMLAQAVAYAGQRQQFGQPIGAFQAVKHHLASVAVAIEFARPVLLRAADAVQHGSRSASIHVSHAKLAAGDAAIQAAETAIQIHGAMGYTYEVDLHFWMKRAWALAGAWGDRALHLGRINAAILRGTLSTGPSHTFV
ncbi:acyl-CoA dehydrogenase family protein [Sphingomonas sp. TDK1]|uniref:acyl-CoA dehydrogenase family protein n=1 Tax=Sphingomonas sp. TDK1 TaxID=453247 RepID=UPI0007D9BA5F|nr:acyl-CoA dehydrogenase family protein [Sphingomonas sp. TDK1]OAN66683.1 acyl-CoA dehydrogenase [Sphingomonas sp. TDK1]